MPQKERTPTTKATEEKETARTTRANKGKGNTKNYEGQNKNVRGVESENYDAQSWTEDWQSDCGTWNYSDQGWGE